VEAVTCFFDTIVCRKAAGGKRMTINQIFQPSHSQTAVSVFHLQTKIFLFPGFLLDLQNSYSLPIENPAPVI